ncbi:PVC-type heme-binding CxxCH protein [Chitinophaga deserti]|uniref:PVC-type heme-binding CxxCH protein n=1 Tax=Chitinophaga deserti TaxID=2164099 RepID=UPI000D6B5FDF|nr:PVC-type heme-binding CxxCH protein [Chitinophaga deserti]
MKIRFHVVLVLIITMLTACGREHEGPLQVLFLGHASTHHHSEKYMPLLASALATEGIQFTYADDPAVLDEEILRHYDVLMLYANHDSITPSQEAALLGFVKGGKGFVPVHCASYCFRNSAEFVKMTGGQFKTHDTGTFNVTTLDTTHPVMQGLQPFTTWDETYIHDHLSDDRTVLQERPEQGRNEPWTWVKEYGSGRVFYTAYGHDERTWSQTGFHQLLKNGILWAAGDKAKKRWEAWRASMPTLEYRDEANIPNYEKRDPAPRYQLPLSPEASAKLIQVPPGCELQLFASEPDIINPIAMAWDEKGRLWVIETVDYPNTVRGTEGQGDDRIKICEDTDGDGRADKFTIFADHLNIPTSLVFANGGIIVSQAPHFLFLQDTNGDDKADVRKTILSGWGTFDTHAGPSNLQYGMDNMIWGTVGYSGFKGNAGGRFQEFGQGVYRFARDMSQFEFMTPTSNNTWGLGFNAANDVFASTANNTHSVYMGIPNAALVGVEGAPVAGSMKIDGHYAMHPITGLVRQVDVFGGFTAAAGHAFYTAASYPASYNNTAFVCEPTGHVVHVARIEKDGAGFREKDGWNLFASADEWVSPVDAKTGPDGAVWVLDWYNFIVQHNPTPTPERGGYAAENGKGNAYENPLRDKTHGRIWRVVHRASKPSPAVKLSDAGSYLDAFSHENLFWRMTAQRLLVEKKDTTKMQQLAEMTAGKAPAALHALWAIDGLGASASQRNVIEKALRHEDAAVRKAAVQILARHRWNGQQALAGNILNDSDPNTRLAAFVALAGLPVSDELGRKLYGFSQEPAVQKDPWLAKGVYTAAARHRKGFITAFLEANPRFGEAAPAEVNRSAPALDDKAWKQMRLPQYFEEAGLEIDGIVWFRLAADIPADMAGKPALLSLGPVDDSDETFINGKPVGKTDKLWAQPRKYKLAAGVLKPGRNIIAVKVIDTGGGGGIYGKPEDMYIEAGGKKIPLAGEWLYETEKVFGGDGIKLFSDRSLAETFVYTYLHKQDASTTQAPAGKADQTVLLKVIQNEMKYDQASFTVKAGTVVDVVLENPDFMQHNLVIVRPGTLQTVGQAANKLAADPKGAEMNYVPDMPEVLFATRLVNPQETVTLRFLVPAEAGDYPFVCTFPGHWSIMNGVMKVVR